MKHLPILIFLVLFIEKGHTQWSLQTNLGFATETNLGDSGLRLSTKLERQLGSRWNAFAQIGAFQMFQSNENWEGTEAFRENRSLSTANLDLGLGFSLLSKSRIRLDLQTAGAYRIGRQLWPEVAGTINGEPKILYTHEKISELGYVLGLSLGIKASENVWVVLDTHCHNYDYFGEYLGAGLGAKIRL